MFKKIKERIKDKTCQEIFFNYAVSLNPLSVDPTQIVYTDPETSKCEQLFPDDLEIICVCGDILHFDVADYLFKFNESADVILFLGNERIDCVFHDNINDKIIKSIDKKWKYFGEPISRNMKIKNGHHRHPVYNAVICDSDRIWFDKARIHAFLRSAGKIDFTEVPIETIK